MKFWLAALAALTVMRLLLAATFPLSPDETYYWIWSVHLQPGYFDHPPMVAYWIRAGTALFGNTPLGVRFCGPLAAAAGSVLLWDAGEHFLPKRHAGLIAAGLLNATILLGVGSVIMTPDTPLVFCWTAALAGLARLQASRDARWWLAIGAAVGAAMLSKYTGLLLAAGIFLWLVSHADGRAQLLSPWPWAAAGIAALIFAPDVYWNAAHGWVSYFKQGGRVEGFDLSRSAGFLLELVAGQICLATPIAVGLAIAGLWHSRGGTAAGPRILLWLTLLPASVFFEHVVAGRVQANWPAVLFPGAFLSAGFLAEPVITKWLRPALGLGFGLTALVYAQAIAAPFPVPAAHDPTALQLSGWQGLADEVASARPAFVTSDEYAVASELAFHLPASIPMVGYDRRWQYFNLPTPNLPAEQEGILVTRRTDTPCPEMVGVVTRRRGDDEIARYRLCRFAPAPGMALLPHP